MNYVYKITYHTVDYAKSYKEMVINILSLTLRKNMHVLMNPIIMSISYQV